MRRAWSVRERYGGHAAAFFDKRKIVARLGRPRLASCSTFDRKFRTAKRSIVTQTLPSGWVRLVRARRIVRRFWGGLSQCYFAPGYTNVFAEPFRSLSSSRRSDSRGKSWRTLRPGVAQAEHRVSCRSRIMELRGRSLSLVMAPPVFSYRPLARRRGVPDRASPGAAFGAVRVPDRPRHRV
jgi:hypothetical protein